MAYSTQADLAAAFGAAELAQIAPDGSGGTDAARVNAALERASRQADSYLATRYPVPVAAPGPELTGATNDLARWWLYDDAATEEVTRRRDHAIAWLRDIASGRAILPEAAGTTKPPAPAAIVAPAPVFDADTRARMQPKAGS